MIVDFHGTFVLMKMVLMKVVFSVHFGSRLFDLVSKTSLLQRGVSYFLFFFASAVEFSWFARDGVRWTFPVVGSQNIRGGGAPFLSGG